jgi:hypothetical protein
MHFAKNSTNIQWILSQPGIKFQQRYSNGFEDVYPQAQYMWLVTFSMYACCNQTINGNQGVEANKIIEFI